MRAHVPYPPLPFLHVEKGVDHRSRIAWQARPTFVVRDVRGRVEQVVDAWRSHPEKQHVFNWCSIGAPHV